MEIEKRNGKRGVVIREDKYGIEVLTMRNGYQWSGMPMDAELIDMLEQAIVEFKNTQASPASAPEGCSPTLTECPRFHNDISKCDGVFAAPTPPVSEGVDTVMTKEELIAAAESIGMRFPGASIPPVSKDWKDAPQEDYFADACRLALELECLLLDCKDTAVTAKWWDSAHEALEQHRERIAAMQEDKKP